MDTNTSTYFDGARLKRCVKQAGYSLNAFCKELGIAKTTFYNYRAGTRPVPRELRGRIEELLGCSFQEFFIPNQEPFLRILPTDQKQYKQQP